MMQSDQRVYEIYNAVIAQKYIVAMFSNIGHGYYLIAEEVCVYLI